MDKSNSNAQLAATPQHAPIAPAGSTGSPLFVINLCASIAPVRLDGNNIPGLENYRLYQVSRVEDGRTRHRLRLGFFTSESHAESVLTVVRQQYPTAFTTCLCEEDRRFVRGYLPNSAAEPKTVSAAPVAKPAPVAAAKAAPAKQAAPAPKPSAPVDPQIVELTWEPETSAKATAPTAGAAKATTATKAASAPGDGLDEFTWQPPSLMPAADAAIAKSSAGGVVKAKPVADKPAVAQTSDTAKHPALKVSAKPPAAKSAAPAAAKAPTHAPAKPAVKTPSPTAAAPNKTDTAASMRVRALDLTFSDPPPPPVQTQRTGPAEPFHVGKGVQFKDSGIRLEAEHPAPAQPAARANTPNVDKPVVTPKPIATPTPKAPAKFAKPVHTPTAAVTPKPATPTIQPAVRVTGSASTPPPELDSTQTIRALTSAEMEDQQQEKWFAVELAVSDQPVNLDAMPRLDIFEAYRLYSVATAGSGKIVHSLRLGFFREAVSAEAVAGYLKTFFGSPNVMRVSVAEHARFKDPPSSKKPAAPAHEAKVVEFNNARATRPVVPTVTMEVTPSVDTSATGSFKTSATGTHKALTGTHKALKSAAKSAGLKTKTARASTGNSGRHKALQPAVRKSLAEELLEEAREVALSESGVRKLPKNDSLLSRMFGKLTK